MSELRTVAILCAAPKSVYHQIQGVDIYDAKRDARTFAGGKPVAGHPPCRCYSAFCQHQAKPVDRKAEMDLGVWCVEQVRKWGGVIEQPAHSRLWDACHIPKPGWTHNAKEWSMEIPQYWFGDAREKNTWLFFCGINPNDLPEMPFRLKPEGGDRRIWQLMSSRNQRERTPPAFAQWLVDAARKSKA